MAGLPQYCCEQPLEPEPSFARFGQVSAEPCGERKEASE